MYMVLSSWQSHCESSPGSFDDCRTAPSGRRPKTKPDDLGCESACTGCQKLHPPSPFIIITQPESWYSFYRPTEGRRLSRPSWLVTYRDGLPVHRRSPTGLKSGALGGHASGGIKFGVSLFAAWWQCHVHGERHDFSDVNITSPGKGCIHGMQRSKFTSMISIHLQSCVPKIIKKTMCIFVKVILKKISGTFFMWTRCSYYSQLIKRYVSCWIVPLPMSERLSRPS